MGIMYLIKLNSGDYRPVYGSDYDASKKIKVGAEVKATKARNSMFHRKVWALLTLGYENQDKYDDISAYRMICTIKAGYYIKVESKTGDYYLPKSWSFENMKQDEFEQLFESLRTVIKSELDLTDEIINMEISNYY